MLEIYPRGINHVNAWISKENVQRNFTLDRKMMGRAKREDGSIGMSGDIIEMEPMPNENTHINCNSAIIVRIKVLEHT